MAAMAGILNRSLTAGQALTGPAATPMASPAATSGTGSTSGSSSSSSSSATISANDFLTLLVTEMQNQDPTATTDPNEYINQLVSVNSLEQLININQTLTSGLGSSTSGTGGSSPSTQAASSGSASSSGLTGSGPAGQVQPAVAANQTNTAGLISQATSKLAPGNLSIPNTNPAANRVAQALNGKTHTL